MLTKADSIGSEMSEMSEQKTKNTHLVAALYILLLSVLMYMLRQNSIANEEVRRLISHTLATHESAEIPEQNSKKARLTKAAEALVDAARLETDAFTSEELDENLEYLKIYLNKVPQKLDSSNEKLDAEINKLTALIEAKVADNLDKVVQQLDSSNESFGDQINKLTHYVAAATSELTALKSYSSTKKLDAEINKLTAEAKVADNLDKVVQQLDSSNESFGDQINILTQHVAAATSELTALKSLMAEDTSKRNFREL